MTGPYMLTGRIDRTQAGVLAASNIGLMFGFSVVAMSCFGLFVRPLSDHYGWGRGDVSVAFSVMSYSGAFAAPVVGILLDRQGIRPVLLPSILLFGFVLASLAFLSNHIWHLYLAYGLLALAAAGTAPPTYARAITQWFDGRRGLALGIALAGIGIGTAAIPPFGQYVIGLWGWQAAYLALAGLVLFISFPISWLYMKDKELGGEASSLPAAQPGYSFAQILLTRTFWQMAFGFTMLGIFTSGIMTHLIPMLQDFGQGEERAAFALSVLGISLVVGRVLAGVLLDELHAPWVVTLCIMGPITGIAMLLTGGSGSAHYFIAVALMGFGIGAELDFMSYLISRYHGLLAYSRTYGVIYGIFVLGSGAGPLVMGYGQQMTGSYDFGLKLLLLLTASAVPCFLFLGKYPRFPRAPDSDARQIDVTACDP